MDPYGEQIPDDPQAEQKTEPNTATAAKMAIIIVELHLKLY